MNEQEPKESPPKLSPELKSMLRQKILLKKIISALRERRLRLQKEGTLKLSGSPMDEHQEGDD